MVLSFRARIEVADLAIAVLRGRNLSLDSTGSRRKESDRRGGEGAGGQEIECHLEATGGILCQTHDSWSDIAAEVADGVDERDPTGGCGSRERKREGSAQKT